MFLFLYLDQEPEWWNENLKWKLLLVKRKNYYIIHYFKQKIHMHIGNLENIEHHKWENDNSDCKVSFITDWFVLFLIVPIFVAYNGMDVLMVLSKHYVVNLYW